MTYVILFVIYSVQEVNNYFNYISLKLRNVLLSCLIDNFIDLILIKCVFQNGIVVHEK
jgi:hypothetical protein